MSTRRGTRRGTVVGFDEPVGIGVVADEDGVRWPFHCVSIADGSRRVEVGTAVTFVVEFRTLRREAVRIDKT